MVVLKGINQKLGVSVYPNPATERINIIFPSSIKKHTTKLISTTGQIMLQTQKNSIDVKPFAKGLYIVNIETEAGVVNEKLVIK